MRDVEENLRAAIVQALRWLEENAPGRAHEALMNALGGQTENKALNSLSAPAFRRSASLSVKRKATKAK